MKCQSNGMATWVRCGAMAVLTILCCSCRTLINTYEHPRRNPPIARSGLRAEIANTTISYAGEVGIKWDKGCVCVAQDMWQNAFTESIKTCIENSGVFEQVRASPCGLPKGLASGQNETDADIVFVGDIALINSGGTAYCINWIFPPAALSFFGLRTLCVPYTDRQRLVVNAYDGRLNTPLWKYDSGIVAKTRICWDTPWAACCTDYPKEVTAMVFQDFEKRLDDFLQSESFASLRRQRNRPKPSEAGMVGTSGNSSVPLQSTSSPGVKRYALIVGVSQYQHAGSGGVGNLAYAASDALGFRDTLLAQGWSPDRVKCLTDTQATRTEVEKWLRYGPDMENALFVVYWAGHGYPDPMDGRRLFLACHDTDLSNPATGLRMSDIKSWLEERKARNVVVLADACHAGGLISGRGAGDDSTRGMTARMKPDSVPPGWVYLLGARTDDRAAEHPSVQGGLFTRSLIDGLGGAADGYGMMGRKDGIVTLGEIREYVREKVKDRAFQLNLTGAFETVDYVNTGDSAIWALPLKATP